MSYNRRFWFVVATVVFLGSVVSLWPLSGASNPGVSVCLSAYFSTAGPPFREKDPETLARVANPEKESDNSQGGDVAASPSKVGNPVLEINGFVQKNGRPVKAGKVKLTAQPWGTRFHQSVQVDLRNDGSFRVSNAPAFQDLKPDEQLEVTAEVWSPELDGVAKEVVYRNYPVPKWMWKSIVALAVAMGGLFLWAFTGQARRIKNRAAIMLSYCVILLSFGIALIGPILLIRGVPALQKLSSTTPVGLIVAQLTEDSKPEWMLNIGGYKISEDSITAISSSNSSLEEQSAEPQQSEDRQITPTRPVLQVLTLKGGMQVPLYVIILAVIGGAINMTRHIPKFQLDLDEHDGEEKREKSEMSDAEKCDHEIRIAWRKGLLEQYMYLISAPFLAIATYYLLVLLGAVQPSIIVLVCFSIGLVSDSVVSAITDIVKKALGGNGNSAPVPARTPPQPAL